MPPEQKAVMFCLVVGVLGLFWLIISALALIKIYTKQVSANIEMIRLRNFLESQEKLLELVDHRVSCLILFSKKDALRKAAGLDSPEEREKILGSEDKEKA